MHFRGPLRRNILEQTPFCCSRNPNFQSSEPGRCSFASHGLEISFGHSSRIFFIRADFPNRTLLPPPQHVCHEFHIICPLQRKKNKRAETSRLLGGAIGAGSSLKKPQHPSPNWRFWPLFQVTAFDQAGVFQSSYTTCATNEVESS